MGRHKEWRKMAKKAMRKRRRIAEAAERDERNRLAQEKRARSPSYRKWLEEEEQVEKFRAEEEERIRKELHNRWLREEELAQERWKKQQKKLERLKAEKAKQELIIREEWEREQQKLKEEAEAINRERERVEQEQAELLNRIEKYVTGESERLPSSVRTVSETQPGCEECPFFAKVAACRFRDTCSRNHIKPSVSRILLFPGFYTNFRLDHASQVTEYDTDVNLEFDDKEIYEEFREFYDDVLSELKTFGTVVQFKVCCNEEPHLRGNVYVQYKSERCAIKALRALQGRYYGGKRISVEFCKIPSWCKAICGLFSRRKCPKGSKCNFLHVFRNPTKEFYLADRDVFEESLSSKIDREHDGWRWSESPEPISRSSREEKSHSRDSIDRPSERKKRKSFREEYRTPEYQHSHSKRRRRDEDGSSHTEKSSRRSKKKKKSRSRSHSASKNGILNDRK